MLELRQNESILVITNDFQVLRGADRRSESMSHHMKAFPGGL